MKLFQKKEKPAKEKSRPVLRLGAHHRLVTALWVLFIAAFVFSIYKNFTAIDIHTVHEVEVVKEQVIDTNNIESFVDNFSRVYFSWSTTEAAISERNEKLKAYLTDDLQTLNKDMITKNTTTTSAFQTFQVWSVSQADSSNYTVLFSVRQLVTETVYETAYNYTTEPEMQEVYNSATGQTEYRETVVEKQITSQTPTTQQRWVMDWYTVTVHVDDTGAMVITRNPTISGAPAKSDYTPETATSDMSVSSAERTEISDFLTSFFTLYPAASEKELSYYVKDGVLKPIDKEYEFKEIKSPVYTSSDGKITARFSVLYFDNDTKATQAAQYSLTLAKGETGNYMIVASGD